MKRFFLAFAIVLGAAFTVKAQEGDIPEIFFKRTIGIVGVPADTLAERMNKWLATNELTAYGYKHIIGADEILRKPRSEKSVYCSIDAPNYFRGKEEAYIVFLLTVRTFRYGASVIMDEINCMRNPILPHFYGLNGVLFRECYDYRHYIAGVKLLDYLSDLFSEQCSSLEAYLKR